MFFCVGSRVGQIALPSSAAALPRAGLGAVGRAFVRIVIYPMVTAAAVIRVIAAFSGASAMILLAASAMLWLAGLACSPHPMD